MRKVSIIMPAYNADKFISEAIESVLAQTYTNWEFIIVDDESKDSTANIVREYLNDDNRIKYFWQRNGKQGNARNRGIRESTGDYLAFMDSDDVWMPDKIMNQVRLLLDLSIDLVFGYSFLIKEGIRTELKIGRGNGLYTGCTAIDFLLHHDAFIMSTVLVKKAVIENVNCFLEDLKIQYCEDWHIWLKLAFEGNSFYTDAKVVSYYRLHDQSAAAVEDKAAIKFVLVLLDLNTRYPSNQLLINEIKKRITSVIYNSKELDKELVYSILKFCKNQNLLQFSVFWYKLVFEINVRFFRKAFLSNSSNYIDK